MTFSQSDKNQLIRQLEEALAAVRVMPVCKSCDDCANFDLSGPIPMCRAAGIEVPAEILAIGCEAYIWDHTLPPF